MKALKMRAFGQFDTREVQVIVGDEEKIAGMRDVLNSFCFSQPKCNRDLRLIDCLSHENNVKILLERLITKCSISNEQAYSLLNRLTECCKENYVYVYTNMFSTCEI